MTLPFIDSEDKARAAVRTINAASADGGPKPIVFSTLVQPNLREIVKDAHGVHLDIFDAFLEPLSDRTRANRRPLRWAVRTV